MMLENPEPMNDDAETRFPPNDKEVPEKAECDLGVLDEWDASIYGCRDQEHPPFIGTCYNSATGRPLGENIRVQSVEACIARAQGYKYFAFGCPMDGGFECWRGNAINGNSLEIDMDECMGTPLTNIGGGQRNNHCTGFPKGTYTQEYQGMTFALGGWHREPVYETNQVSEGECEGVTNNSDSQKCSSVTDWHSSIMPVKASKLCIPVVTLTKQGTCKEFCEDQAFECIRGQDNVGSGCGLDQNHERQTTADNGCNQKWNNQVCQCGHKIQ